MKKAAVEAVAASNPCSILFGKVISVSPLKILVEQRLTLDESYLVLTSLVRDFEIDMTMNHFTDEDAFLDTEHNHSFSGTGSVQNASFDSTHKHAITGRKTFQVHLGLAVGEAVMLMAVQGGQKYIVLDRVVIT
jgi:hypothetical protein